MTVSRVDIHHEGSGAPSGNLDRFATGGYVLGIGDGQWKIFRRDVDNWATAHFNHVDLAVCFSGDRMVHSITDDDLRCLREALAEERRRGEITDQPEVHPHGTLYRAPGGNLPGSSPTQCPGIKTLDRWPEIVAACQATAPAPPPPPPPEDDVKILIEANMPEGYANPFCGVEIDIANQSVALIGGAGFVPAPGPYIGTWRNAVRVGNDTDGVTRVRIVNDKGEQFTFRVKPRP